MGFNFQSVDPLTPSLSGDLVSGTTPIYDYTKVVDMPPDEGIAKRCGTAFTSCKKTNCNGFSDCVHLTSTNSACITISTTCPDNQTIFTAYRQATPCELGGDGSTCNCSSTSTTKCIPENGDSICKVGGLGSIIPYATYKNKPVLINDAAMTFPSDTDPNYTNATVSCKYSYNFDNFNSDMKSNDLITKIIAVCNRKNGTPSGFVPAAGQRADYFLPLFRNFSIVYAIILEFYNRIYSTGFYDKTPNRINYLDDSEVNNLKTKITIPYQNNIELTQLYPNEKVLTDMLASISSKCLMTPAVSYNNNTYNIQITVSQSQYASFFNTPKKDFASDIVMDLIYSFFQDQMGQYYYNGKLVTAPNPTFKPVTEDNINIISGILSDSPVVYSTVKKPTDIDTENGYSFLVATVDLTVDKWSPMLLAYFTTKIPNLAFDSTICNNIYQNDGANPMIVPNICLTQECDDKGNSPTCINTIKKYCGFTYTPPSFIGPLSNDLLVNPNNINCNCYSTKLLPISQMGKEDSEKAGMCFTVDCSSSQLDNFGITSIDCKKGCEQVNEWITTTNPLMKSQRIDLLNKTKFDSICGKNYQSPYFTPMVNKFVVLVGGIITIVLGLELWHTQLNVGIKIFVTLVTIAIFIYLSIDLAGRGMCDKTKDKLDYICQSKLSKINIPTEFCEGPPLPCECLLDNDCSNDCTCVNSVCYPPSLNRKTTIEKYRKTQVVGIIFGIISILIGFSLMFTYHVNNTIKLIIGVLTTVPLIYSIIMSIIPKSKTVYSGTCGDSST